MYTSMQEEFSERAVTLNDVTLNCFIEASKGIFLFLLPCSGKKLREFTGNMEFMALGRIFNYRKFGRG